MKQEKEPGHPFHQQRYAEMVAPATSPPERMGYFIILAVWLLFQAIWYVRFGVHFDQEAGKYISGAEYILQHHRLPETRLIFYFTTTAVIGFCLATGLGLYGAVLIISLINLVCYLYFFKALLVLFGSRLPALLAVGFLIYFWPYQSWTLFLFTESLFYSAVVLLFSHLILFRQLTSRFLGVLALLLILVVISRPLGILFILPALLFVFSKLSRRQRLIAGLFGAGFLLLMNVAVQVVFTTTPDWSMTKALSEDSIICNMPRRSSAAGLKLSDDPNQLYQLFYYVVHNFLHFLELAFIRLRYFFLMVRDYYSTFHNAYLLIHLLALYGSILVGLKRISRTFPRSLGLFILSSIMLFAVTIAVQRDDYHNRFALTLLPFYVTLALWVWKPLLEKISFLK